MSESYFRKKFVGCMGMTPVEYRNAHRFSLARHLYSEGKTLEEIYEGTSRDSYFEAPEAVEFGLADRVIETL